MLALETFSTSSYNAGLSSHLPKLGSRVVAKGQQKDRKNSILNKSTTSRCLTSGFHYLPRPGVQWLSCNTHLRSSYSWNYASSITTRNHVLANTLKSLSLKPKELKSDAEAESIYPAMARAAQRRRI